MVYALERSSGDELKNLCIFGWSRRGAAWVKATPSPSLGPASVCGARRQRRAWPGVAAASGPREPQKSERDRLSPRSADELP